MTEPPAEPTPRHLSTPSGDYGIDTIVDRFYDKVLADPDLEPFFQGASMARIRAMQEQFFGAALGEPVTYTGLDLAAAHAHLGIHRRHVSAFVGHLLDTLDELDIDDEASQRLIATLSLSVDDIVGGHGEDG